MASGMEDDAGLDTLRRLLAASPELLADVAAITDREAFAARLAAWACDQGMALSAGTILDSFYRLHAAPVGPILDGLAPPGWLPARITEDEAPKLVWAHFGDARLTEGFFDDSLRVAQQRPINQLLQPVTPLSGLLGGAPATPPPDGFIFHLSRCGSTLVAQMLAALPTALVLSEAPPIDAAVRFGSAELLRAVIGAYRRRGEARCFVKLDSWHSLSLPLFRAAFPDVPWIFLHRDPIEVMVSQIRRRGIHTVPGLVPPEQLGLEPLAGPPDADYCARVISHIGEGAAEHFALGGGIAVDYAELPDAVADRILPHFGILPSDAERAAMDAVTRRDAKRPGMLFQPDSAAKQEAADAPLRTIVDRHFGTLQSRLRALG